VCPAAIPSSSTSTVIQMTYDSGAGCTTGELCGVTEADGQTWNYQYQNDGSPYATNMVKVLDPLGDTEESNGYADDYVVFQQTGNCSSCADTGGVMNISYPPNAIAESLPGGAVTVTDGAGRSTTYK
jgi:YD repeat-containing protein